MWGIDTDVLKNGKILVSVDFNEMRDQPVVKDILDVCSGEVHRMFRSVNIDQLDALYFENQQHSYEAYLMMLIGLFEMYREDGQDLVFFDLNGLAILGKLSRFTLVEQNLNLLREWTSVEDATFSYSAVADVLLQMLAVAKDVTLKEEPPLRYFNKFGVAADGKVADDAPILTYEPLFRKGREELKDLFLRVIAGASECQGKPHMLKIKEDVRSNLILLANLGSPFLVCNELINLVSGNEYVSSQRFYTLFNLLIVAQCLTINKEDTNK